MSPPDTVAAVAPIESLPPVGLGQVMGLIEVVHVHGGRMDVFVLDELTDYDFGQTLSVVKAGEMLDLLDTPKNDVILSDLGRLLLTQDTTGARR